MMAAMTHERFRALVEEYQTQVYNLALRMMREPAAAEDVCQEAFISAYRAFSSFRGENPKAWLMRIATNTCYDFLRRSARRPAVSLEVDDPDALRQGSGNVRTIEVADRGRGPEEEALARERERVISALLMELGEEYRAVLVMSDVQGMSYEEIAAATGVGLGTVKSRLSRARARMRDLLTGQRELFPLVERLTK